LNVSASGKVASTVSPFFSSISAARRPKAVAITTSPSDSVYPSRAAAVTTAQPNARNLSASPASDGRITQTESTITPRSVS